MKEIFEQWLFVIIFSIPVLKFRFLWDSCSMSYCLMLKPWHLYLLLAVLMFKYLILLCFEYHISIPMVYHTTWIPYLFSSTFYLTWLACHVSVNKSRSILSVIVSLVWTTRNFFYHCSVVASTRDSLVAW